ncbi:1,4-dihydroxy-2-naphthoate octaprenyltransferase [Jeotgalicoccus aerolatus]|uniref:1,4-dihydroxy-2-naphthoate octaprenyltransferase n=1 Tax=Jeotgalicoccus aerolatus TaxID=709510 RepID=A0ABS4HNZ4_9STAP|nr:1,4-dihydroxy-2-naphthoate polyprenyltransferase [Jeotgalicoccus aerolatus]MBP1952626.1 1,4-dihydroxy-2-naphthoate octaprenyltransferase [Jeotgalicoccus aerolatus]GGD92106.1 1,4-dihydroxy-2-naphthoate octaprenyltransferase [Jeotgalicoccus aerolatus]CAD2074187.1 1,4-dihydroxy-2-naphthoate octaprenyltransferase [Jeotgalicoccus aerolatus]
MQEAQVHTGFKKYLMLTRPHTLTASFVPVFVGTASVLLFADIRWGMFFLMLIATILIQSATNMFNEYYDFKRGLDSHESVGIAGAIVRNGMSPRLVLTIALIFYGIAAVIGIIITINSSWWILVIGAVSMAVGYLYTGGPVPISWTPFGEIFAGFFMGTVIIMITFSIHTGTLHVFPLLMSIPPAITIGLLNMANNIRDRKKDKESGRKTYVILVGKPIAVMTAAVLLIFSYVFLIYITFFTSMGSLFLLIPLLSIPLAMKTIMLMKKGDTPPELIPAMASMGKLNTIMGLLLTIGLIIYGITGI